MSDYFTSLPEELRARILSFLDSPEEMARTSILCKSWLNTWTQVPRIRVVRPEEEAETPYPQLRRYIQMVGQDELLLRNARNMLRRHRGPIHEFHLELRFDSTNLFVRYDLTDDVALLAQKNVRRLEIVNFHVHGYGLVLPPAMSSLVSLMLRGCHLCIPSRFQGFDSLESFELTDVRTPDRSCYERIIASSRKLRRARLAWRMDLPAPADPSPVYIRSQILEELSLDWQWIRVASAPQLRSVSLVLRCHGSDDKKVMISYLLDLFSDISGVQELTAHDAELLVQSIFRMPQLICNKPRPFVRLESLTLRMSMARLDMFAYLLANAPYLKNISIIVYRELEFWPLASDVADQVCTKDGQEA